jgi:hypothetical protein
MDVGLARDVPHDPVSVGPFVLVARDAVSPACDECDMCAAVEQPSDERESQARGAARNRNAEPPYGCL